MDWSPQQAQGLEAAANWLANPGDKKVFKLFGYAGTGKSTLAKALGEMESKRKGYTQFAAFTGKAAVVMRKKGCLNARTLHSIMYTSMDKPVDDLDKLTAALDKAEGADKIEIQRLIDLEKESLKQPAFSMKPDALTVWEEDYESGFRRPMHTISLFIIDECSMVDDRLGSDLLGLGCRVLVLGDPAQLPPVASGAGYFTNGKPDVLLTEIHRQAEGSPIIKMANTIRKGNALALGDYGQGCRVVKAEEIKGQQDIWLNADQVLVGLNKTKTAFNTRIRNLKGFSGFLPEPGEKLVCLANNHKEGLLNGSLWEVVAVEDRPKYHTFDLEIRSLDENRTVKCLAHKSVFLNRELNPWEKADANQFDFGYALTVHKSQGSQWNDVVLFNEWFNRSTKCQWQYTGITRAAERITVVQP